VLRFGVVLVSALIALAALTSALERYGTSLGADLSRRYLCQPRPSMWRPHEAIGHVNRPGVERRAFGDIVGRTNGAGFRSDEELSEGETPGTLRVIGIGDSVTWGTRVDREKSFLGVLGTLLESVHPDSEVVNAGVVGYSTYQERLMLEQHVLRYDPDVVIVNYCDNDLLPTEDPFDNARRIHLELLERLENGDAPIALDERQRAALVELRGILGRAPHVWDAVRESTVDRDVLRSLLLEIPIREMAAIARAHEIRLVYVFIPDTRPTAGQRRVQLRLQELLREIDVEYVDVAGDLVTGPTTPAERESSGRRFVRRASSVLDRALDRPVLRRLNPIPPLRRIQSYRAFRRRHAEALFIDDLGHPTERGHRIIAMRLFEALTREH